MCGILGVYAVSGYCIRDAVNRLKILEYRGYDSWGIAYLTREGIKSIKHVGEISKANIESNDKSNIIIAHTRWATHGNVSETNAHPHHSQNKNVWIVHNGIIENFKDLKSELKSKGYEFYSSTDTEVIANLVEYYLKSSNEIEAFIKALRRLKGSYAIVGIINNKMFAAAKSSPLLIGIGDNAIYLSSDAKSFIDDVKYIAAFNDEEIASIGKEVVFYNLDGEIINKSFESVEDISKYGAYEPLNGYDHYTIKEIEEQKSKFTDIASYLEKDIEKLAKEISNAYGVFFIASGSSYHACLAASYMFSKYARMHVNVVDASEFEYYKHFLTPKTLVIAVSQSGETADVIEAVKVAKSKGSKIAGITNVYGSTLYRIADIPLLMHAGTEISVVATKTYTSQLLILSLLVFSIIHMKEVVYSKFEDLIKGAKELLSESFEHKMKSIAQEIKDEEHLYIIGRGINYATALEGALKIKEISYIHAEAFAGGALKHGSIALIEPGSVVIAIAPEDETYDEIISNVMEVKARGAKVIGITTKHNDIFDIEILVPKCEPFQAILNIIPLQLIAYWLAVLRGNNPDKPRNLAKSVTVK